MEELKRKSDAIIEQHVQREKEQDPNQGLIQDGEAEKKYLREHGFARAQFSIVHDLVQLNDENSEMHADLEEAKSVLLDRQHIAEIQKYQDEENIKIKVAEEKAKSFAVKNGFTPSNFEIVGEE